MKNYELISKFLFLNILLHSLQLDLNRVGLLEKHKITGKMHKFILSRAFIQKYKRYQKEAKIHEEISAIKSHSAEHRVLLRGVVLAGGLELLGKGSG
jgi:hypothetical protein